MLTNQGNKELSAPKPITLAKFKNCDIEYNYSKSQQVGASLNWSVLDRLSKYLNQNQIGLHEFLNLAIAAENEEILDEYFEGISQEQFASLFPTLKKPPFHKNKKRITFRVNGAALLCAKRLAAPNLTFSEYLNRAVWKVLQKRSS